MRFRTKLHTQALAAVVTVFALAAAASADEPLRWKSLILVAFAGLPKAPGLEIRM